ncbi:MAG: helix-turn-helix transcriptional regulator [Oscillospiraceae bacterium]|nr:helix-turn-helix transcriptional regulator [Oscillospiraceae bacterium]
MMDLKDRLTELRREKGWNQDELALKLNVTRQAVSKWERGAAVPSIDNLVYIGRLYGIPLDELVNGRPQCEEPPATTAAVAEPENILAPQRHRPMRLAVAAVLAGCIFLTGVAAGIMIGSTALREPGRPKDGLTIISQDDLEWEDIDLTEVQDWTGKTTNIVP